VNAKKERIADCEEKKKENPTQRGKRSSKKKKKEKKKKNPKKKEKTAGKGTRRFELREKSPASSENAHSREKCKRLRGKGFIPRKGGEW